MSSVPRWMWLDAELVAAQGMRDLLAGRPVSVPSRRYAALTTLARHLPRRVVARAARRGR
jgi:short-subunit dehydrogenase